MIIFKWLYLAAHGCNSNQSESESEVVATSELWPYGGAAEALKVSDFVVPLSDYLRALLTRGSKPPWRAHSVHRCGIDAAGSYW